MRNVGAMPVSLELFRSMLDLADDHPIARGGRLLEPLTPAGVAAALKLPPGHEILGADRVEPFGTVEIYIEGPLMPACGEGEAARPVIAIYRSIYRDGAKVDFEFIEFQSR